MSNINALICSIRTSIRKTVIILEMKLLLAALLRENCQNKKNCSIWMRNFKIQLDTFTPKIQVSYTPRSLFI